MKHTHNNKQRQIYTQTNKMARPVVDGIVSCINRKPNLWETTYPYRCSYTMSAMSTQTRMAVGEVHPEVIEAWRDDMNHGPVTCTSYSESAAIVMSFYPLHPIAWSSTPTLHSTSLKCTSTWSQYQLFSLHPWSVLQLEVNTNSSLYIPEVYFNLKSIPTLHSTSLKCTSTWSQYQLFTLHPWSVLQLKSIPTLRSTSLKCTSIWSQYQLFSLHPWSVLQLMSIPTLHSTSLKCTSTWSQYQLFTLHPWSVLQLKSIPTLHSTSLKCTSTKVNSNSSLYIPEVYFN